MTLDEAISACANAGGNLPVEAVQWSLDHWDDVAPRFLDILAHAVADPAPDNEDDDTAFIIIHLCAAQAERRAFPILCRVLGDRDRLEDLIGSDGASVVLSGMLINCFDGGDTAMRAVVMDQNADSYLRGEVLLALAWLTREGRYPEAAMRGLLTESLAKAGPRKTDFFWFQWSAAIEALGWPDFVPAVEKLYRDRFIERDISDLKAFRESLRTTMDDPDRLAGFEEHEVAPYGDAIDTLGLWFNDREDEAEEPAHEISADRTPRVNPLRNVGRNDPCPCGSGKKFKKCCLEAA